MCGLVGVVGKISLKEKSVFKTLLQLDTIRGHHSTGVVIVSGNDNEAVIHKKLGTPWELFDSKSYDDAIRNTKIKALIGHNRWATKGKVSVGNAHPFNHGHIYGAHNGTLVTQYGLLDHTKFDVDSDNLYYDMSVNGVEDTIPRVNGAYALTWYDSELEAVNMLRNSQRPLCLAKAVDGSCVFWASESWMLTVALGKEGIAIDKIEELPVMQQYSFTIPRGGAQNVSGAKVHTHIEYKPKTTQPTTTTTNNNSGLSSFVGKSVVFSVSKEETNEYGVKYVLCEPVDIKLPMLRVYYYSDKNLLNTLMTSTGYFEGEVQGFLQGMGHLLIKSSSIKEVEFDDSVSETFLVGQEQRVVDFEGFRKAVKCGCSWCNAVPLSAEADSIVWFTQGFLCPDCAETEELKFLNIQ